MELFQTLVTSHRVLRLSPGFQTNTFVHFSQTSHGCVEKRAMCCNVIFKSKNIKQYFPYEYQDNIYKFWIFFFLNVPSE